MIRTSRIGSGPTSSAPASSVRRGAGSTGRLRGPPATAATDAALLRIEILRVGKQIVRVGTNVNQISRSLHRGPAQVPEDLATRLDQVAALVAATRTLIGERTS